MTSTKDLLVEIGTEELPPTALKKLSDCFSQEIISQLEKSDLAFQDFQSFATPRRLAILVKQLQTKQKDKTIDRKGPALKAAYDNDGNPTKAAQGFARSCGVSVADLEKVETDKGTWLSFKINEIGKNTAEILPTIIKNSLDKLPIPKRMRWGDLDAQFVRPVHWAIVMLGEDIIETEILSVKSAQNTYGHRFHFPQAITIDQPANYESLLEQQGRVIPSFSKRRELIRQQINEVAEKQNAVAVIDENLLDEVTGMIELPTAIQGSFDQEFLDVPAEALISAMKKHQKYFHLVDQNDKLLPHFITISNVQSSEPTQVKEGNERVIRPRLSDARFFWTQDLKIPLDSRIDSLKTVVFQNKLGTLYDKTQRVTQLSEQIAEILGVDSELAKRAAQLAKTDLMSDMINEFPDLQGIMGRYYAEHHEENQQVAKALDEQYLPRFAGDAIAHNQIGQTLAIAERIDTLCGIFAIGLIPTGDKDPFALRRSALGLIRTIVENNLDLDIQDLLKYSAECYGKDIDASQAIDAILKFVKDRLKSYVIEKGYGIDEFDAVAALNIYQPSDFIKRLSAVKQFKELPEAENLAAANKRIGNILKKVNNSNFDQINQDLLNEISEQELFQQLNQIKEQVEPLYQKNDYTQILQTLAALKTAIDSFFDNVMVMVDDEELKTNRINLLAHVRSLFIQVADLSHLS